MLGRTDFVCFIRVSDFIQSNVTYKVSPTTHRSPWSHIAIWSRETACQTAVISCLWVGISLFAEENFQEEASFSLFVFCQDQKMLLIKIGNIYFYEYCVWFILLKDHCLSPKREWKSPIGQRDLASLEKIDLGKIIFPLKFICTK